MKRIFKCMILIAVFLSIWGFILVNSSEEHPQTCLSVRVFTSLVQAIIVSVVVLLAPMFINSVYRTAKEIIKGGADNEII